METMTEPTKENGRRNSRYHSTSTAALRLDCSPETIKKWCQDPTKRARLGAFKPAGGDWKIPFDRFEEMARRAEETGSMF